MEDRTTFGQALGLCLMLLLLVGFAAFSATFPPIAGQSTLAGVGPVPRGPVPADVDCASLITPDRIGDEAYERYGLAEKVQNDGFSAQEYQDYILCLHGQPKYEEQPFFLFADMYYMFDRETGDLVVTYLQLGVEASLPTPTPVPAPTQDPDAVRICIDADMPIVEVGEENPELWDIWDMMGGNCAVQLGSQICFDCGDDLPWHPVVPVPGEPEGEAGGVEAAASGRVCIDVRTAAEVLAESAEGAPADVPPPDHCSLELGALELCWVCVEDLPEPAPSPVPAEGVGKEPVCSDYLTPDRIGHGEWNEYQIGKVLRSGQFKRHLSTDPARIVCYADRVIDGALVSGDELYYMFDIGSRELLRRRIHWTEGLPEQLPPLQISQAEAEAMVEGEVSFSYLGILSPDSMLFDSDWPYTQDPCWFVSSHDGGEFNIPWVTVINAVTGKVVGRYCPC
jgi:hypothetical protein